ncbi:CopD family protein [Candidatus Poriferisocius sp.]|uniref:CopD family protein n=1 Tax=Candidatus Poriferisocius sp. TaxID=3101276 RepID=UPI003B02ECBD
MIEANWDLDTIRVFLHILGAAVWVGGQVVVAALVPALRRVGPEATQAAAQQFARVAWPFFALAVLTGLWNLFEVDGFEDAANSYHVTLTVKMVLVVATGVAAWLHTRATDRRRIAMLGSLSGVASIGAVLVGVAL